MFVFTYRTKIAPQSETAVEFEDIGGAYVNCWISFKDFDAAEKLAEILVREQGWTPEMQTDASRVLKRDCTGEDLEYYAEALKYGYSLVFNLWTKDAEDAGRDYETEAIN